MTFKSKLAALTLGTALVTSVATVALGQGMRAGAMGGPLMGPMSKATFAKIDTNSDKVLSPAEIRAYVAGQIKGLDANGDGFLTADEIAAKISQLDKERITAFATRIADRIGKDGKVSVDDLAKMPLPMDRVMARMLKVGDGKVSQATFEAVEVMGGFQSHHHRGEHRDGRGGRMGDHGPQGWMGDHMGQGYGRMGARMDGHGWMGHDGQGWMARGEQGPMGRDGQGWMGRGGAGHDRMGMMRGRHHGMGAMMGGLPKFAEIDANHDGVITADEYQAYKLARVKAIDTNGDGFVTPAEFADYAVAKMQPRIQQRADALVKKLDLNGDGKVSIEELAAAPFDMMFAHLPTDKNGNVTEQAFLHMGGPGGWHGHDGWRGHHRGGWGGAMVPPPAAGGDAPQGN